MDSELVQITTADGTADCHVYRPAGAGPWPGVIFFMDAPGIRPDLQAMAQRLAGHGYYVLLPNLYYRMADTPPLDLSRIIQNQAERERMLAMARSLTSEKIVRDAHAYLQHLTHAPQVKRARIGCVGYCMGGRFALVAAGRYPDLIGAAASFHGTQLATHQPDSPHLLANAIKAQLYVGVAEIDPSLAPGETERLETALKSAGVRYQVEIYPKVHHGFTVPGLPVYDRDASERHWDRLLKLLREAI